MSAPARPRRQTAPRRPHQRAPQRAPIKASSAATVLLVGVLVVMPTQFSSKSNFLLVLGLINGLTVMSLVVVTGLSGQPSLAQASFMGIGGFFGHFLAEKHGWGFWAPIPLLVLLGLAVALIISIPAVRVRGLYLLIVTWSFGLVADRVVFNWQWLASTDQGGSNQGVTATLSRPEVFGISLVDDRRWAFFIIAVSVLAMLLVRNLARSDAGFALRLQRDSEEAAYSVGLNVRSLRVGAFMVGGVLATLAGYLFLAHQSAVTRTDYSQFMSLNFMLMLILGGVESFVGALVAGVGFAFAPEILNALNLSGSWQFFFLGLAGIALLAVTEGGYGTVISRRTGPLLRALSGTDAAPAPRRPGTRPPATVKSRTSSSSTPDRSRRTQLRAASLVHLWESANGGAAEASPRQRRIYGSVRGHGVEWGSLQTPPQPTAVHSEAEDPNSAGASRPRRVYPTRRSHRSSSSNGARRQPR